jgi:hypothetical protein
MCGHNNCTSWEEIDAIVNGDHIIPVDNTIQQKLMEDRDHLHKVTIGCLFAHLLDGSDLDCFHNKFDQPVMLVSDGTFFAVVRAHGSIPYDFDHHCDGYEVPVLRLLDVVAA